MVLRFKLKVTRGVATGVLQPADEAGMEAVTGLPPVVMASAGGAVGRALSLKVLWEEIGSVLLAVAWDEALVGLLDAEEDWEFDEAPLDVEDWEFDEAPLEVDCVEAVVAWLEEEENDDDDDVGIVVEATEEEEGEDPILGLLEFWDDVDDPVVDWLDDWEDVADFVDTELEDTALILL